MDKEEFMAAFDGVYEHSSWVAEAVWRDGAPALEQSEPLVSQMRTVVDGAGRDAQLALLRAHPDLAGRLAVSGELTADSTAEQASAGLDQCSAEEFERFQTLNSRYVETFAFPFIMAVKGSSRAEILAAFEARVENTAEHEFETALAQVHRIAALRINAWFDQRGETA